MFQILQPIWLFAIAGIAIPVIIHLWNIREGKTFHVGSIFLIEESAKEEAQNLRLKDILLLILRCLLVITLAFLIAKPQWQKQLIATNKKGWIMIERQSLHPAYKNFKQVIDSLVKAGYKFHYFNKDFALDDLEEALKKPADTSNETGISYWTVLKQLNEKVPAELPVYLFTDNRLKRFTGARPQVSMNLKWMTYTSADTVSKRIVKAFRINADSIRLIVANSKPSATFYTSENIVYPTKNSEFLLSGNNGKIYVSRRDSINTNRIEVDTSTLDIIVYTDQFSTDANYIKAAIDAIQQYTGLKIKMSVIDNINSITPNSDWLFWLSEKTLPLQKLPSKIFVYETGTQHQIDSWINPVNSFSINQDPIHLSRLIQNSSASGSSFETLWKDGFGHTVLNLEKTYNNTYHFYSRFNPAWNDLPWSSQFAEMIFDLLILPDVNIKESDNRIIASAQLQPEIVKESKTFNKKNFVETRDLTKLLWLITFIIFCIERYISLVSNKRKAYA
ncbi:MAG: BatA domain-containing protein [Ginsengibacter sp.]